MSEKLDRALWWLERGYELLPVQPDSKILVSGFGEYQRRIRTNLDAKRWYESESCLANMAVMGGLILDFDDPIVYWDWSNLVGDRLELTYTEQTPRGGFHVFYRVGRTQPNRITLVDGVEIKRSVIVAPSVVAGRPYRMGEGEIIEADVLKVFSPLSKSIESRHEVHPAQRERGPGRDVLERIKNQYTVINVLTMFRPGFVLSEGGRFRSGRCPFHEDKKPSFWVDESRGLWGCHACGLHGDVVNLYARFEDVSNLEAIGIMARGLS